MLRFDKTMPATIAGTMNQHQLHLKRESPDLVHQFLSKEINKSKN